MQKVERVMQKAGYSATRPIKKVRKTKTRITGRYLEIDYARKGQRGSVRIKLPNKRLRA